jgi:hypothetical protein
MFSEQRTAKNASNDILPRREQQGSWIGNPWIPPKGWSTTQWMNGLSFTGRDICSGLATRPAPSALYEVLNHKTGRKYIQSEAVVKPSDALSINCPCDTLGRARDDYLLSTCRKILEGGPGQHFLFTRINTLFQLESFLHDEISGRSNMTKRVDLFIVSLRIWAEVQPQDYKDTT